MSLFIWEDTPSALATLAADTGYYIGTRTGQPAMSKILPYPEHLNKKCAKSVSHAVKLVFGNPVTKNGKHIIYYKVTQEQLASLTYEGADTMIALKHNIHLQILVKFSDTELSRVLATVNKHYCDKKGTDDPRYNRQEFKEYEQYLANELTQIIHPHNTEE